MNKIKYLILLLFFTATGYAQQPAPDATTTIVPCKECPISDLNQFPLLNAAGDTTAWVTQHLEEGVVIGEDTIWVKQDIEYTFIKTPTANGDTLVQVFADEVATGEEWCIPAKGNDDGNFTSSDVVTNSNGTGTITYTHVNSDGTPQTTSSLIPIPQKCDGGDIGANDKVWYSKPLTQDTGYGVIYDDQDCPHENDELFDTGLSSYAGSSKDFGNVASGTTSRVGNGRDNLASATRSGVFVGLRNVASGGQSVVVGGKDNIAGTGGNAGVLAGDFNVAAAASSVVVGGTRNTTTQLRSFAGAGIDNTVSGINSNIVSGENNLIELGSSWSGINSGTDNIIGLDINGVAATKSFIGSGGANQVRLQQSIIGAGNKNTITGNTTLYGYDGILSGRDNIIDNVSTSFIGAGQGNSISIGFTSGASSGIGAGGNNIVATQKSWIAAGESNIIDDVIREGFNNAISSGRNNSIIDGTNSFIAGTESSTINNHNESAIVAGEAITADQDNTLFTGHLVIRRGTLVHNAPANTADPVGVEGEIYWNANWLFVKTNVGWKRVALNTF